MRGQGRICVYRPDLSRSHTINEEQKKRMVWPHCHDLYRSHAINEVTKKITKGVGWPHRHDLLNNGVDSAKSPATKQHKSPTNIIIQNAMDIKILKIGAVGGAFDIHCLR